MTKEQHSTPPAHAAGPSFTWRRLSSDEIAYAQALVARVFDQFVGPGYTEEGKQQFHQFIDESAMVGRMARGSILLGAWAGTTLVGMIEFRQDLHISLLFTEPAWHGKGIAKTLCEMALDMALSKASTDMKIGSGHQGTGTSQSMHRVTVNSSPYAVPVYERLGFVATDVEQEMHGIRFVPMSQTLSGNHPNKGNFQPPQ